MLPDKDIPLCINISLSPHGENAETIAALKIYETTTNSYNTTARGRHFFNIRNLVFVGCKARVNHFG